MFDSNAVNRLDPEAIRAMATDATRAAPRRQNRHIDHDAVRAGLEAALTTEPMHALPLEGVAAHLGISSQLVRYHFPQLAHAVSRHWQLGLDVRRRSRRRGNGGSR
jgi:AraC-like DNA-binding protein